MPTEYTWRNRVVTEYTWRNRKIKWKTYLKGYDSNGDIVYICDSLGNKIVIYADSWFEQVDYDERVGRTRI